MQVWGYVYFFIARVGVGGGEWGEGRLEEDGYEKKQKEKEIKGSWTCPFVGDGGPSCT